MTGRNRDAETTLPFSHLDEPRPDITAGNEGEGAIPRLFVVAPSTLTSPRIHSLYLSLSVSVYLSLSLAFSSAASSSSITAIFGRR